MSFRKNLEPEDISISTFQVHKTFSLTEADSGSGFYAVPIIKGTDTNLYNFNIGDASSKTIVYNTSNSSSIFYEVPTYYAINNLYYRDIIQMRGPIDFTRGVPTSSDAVLEYTYTRPFTTNTEPQSFKFRRPYTRQLRNTATVISVPQELYGEYINPYSIQLTDNSTNVTFVLRDDGRGNLYDVAYSASYAAREPNTNTMSGSLVGNVFYTDGMVVITDTGSYGLIGTTSGSDGFTLQFDSTQTIYERSYACTVEQNEFINTTNKSLKVGQSGSIAFKGTPLTGSLFSKTTQDRFPYGMVGYDTSSYNPVGYNIGTELLGVATHSDFNTYITNIGLYNDEGELLALGKPAKPIKNDKELALSFVVRFDTN